MVKPISNPDLEIDYSSDPFELGIELPDGQLTRGDEELLKKYSEGKDLAVDLGTYRGRSAVILSLFARRVVTVDAYCFAGRDAGKWGVNPTFEENKKSLAKFANIELIKSTSGLSAFRFNNEEVDVVFVDAGHGIPAVIGDFEAYLPKLKVGGIFIFHDYKYSDGSNPVMAVKPTVDKIMQERDDVTEVEKVGWSIVMRKIR